MTNPDIYSVSNALYHGNLVAGAAAEGHGAITDWLGRGSRDGASIAAIVRDIIPEAWLPAPKEPGVQLGRAMQAIAGVRYRAEKVRHSADPEVRETEKWLARWMLVTRPVAAGVVAGQKFGDIVLVATLSGDDVSVQLECATEPTDDPAAYSERAQLCTQLRLSYGALVATHVHSASDITRWLGLTLRRRLHAVRYGRSYYLPSETRAQAEALVNAFRSDGWGHSWMYPALPVATSGQLSLGLALSLALDVTELAEELGYARQEAWAAKRLDIGAVALANRREKLDVIKARVNFYASRLGESRSEVDEPIRDLEVVFEEIEANIVAAEAAKLVAA